MNKITILEILFVTFLLLSPIVAGYFTWRIFKLHKRIKLIEKERNTALEEWYKVQREKPTLTVLEKKMIIVSLNVPQYKNTMEDPKTKHEVRKVYRELKERLKESMED